MPTSRTGTSPLQTVDRALEVLLSFTERRADWGVLELAEHLDIDKSSAQRILATLSARRFLQSDPLTRRYSLGPAMWRLAELWERTGGLAELAQDVLDPLARDTGRTSLFAVPDGLHVRCLAAAEGTGPLRSHPLVGEIYPVNAGATSRAYFASLPPVERRALIAGRVFGKFSELTEQDEIVLEGMFAETVRQGFASSEGEYDYSTRAVAVPVLVRGRPVGSLTLVESKFPDHDDTLVDHLPRLHEAARALSSMLDVGADSLTPSH